MAACFHKSLILRHRKKRYNKIAIVRQPELYSQRDYDLIIVGGGIYGVMLTLEAVLRGLRPLLLEREDFGGATSFNSLRIVHGGLRYLQTLDLKRHVESVQERRWFLANFPDLASPLPCLMPLYGKGVRRKSIFRAAMLINDLLSINRNDGVREDRSIPRGKVISKAETVAAFPDVDATNLQGAALWHDAAIPDSQRVVMELLRWAAHYGADAANYMQVSALSIKDNVAGGVVAQDREFGSEWSFRAPVVINSAGPWSEDMAEKMGGKADRWFWPSLAWNILTDKPALSECALALTPPRAGGPTYFLHPWKGRLLIGTGHAPWNGAVDNPITSGEQIEATLDDINASVPGLALTPANVERVFAGLLPAAGPHSARLSTKPAVVDHSKSGGPRGLVSICGVKFTTARRVAAHTLDKVFGAKRAGGGSGSPRPHAAQAWQSGTVDFSDDGANQRYREGLGRLVADESPMNLRDVVFRRTDLWESPDLALRLAPKICDSFAWREDRKEAELAALGEELARPDSR